MIKNVKGIILTNTRFATF